jgi:hypothetical protein
MLRLLAFHRSIATLRQMGAIGLQHQRLFSDTNFSTRVSQALFPLL